MRKGLESVSVDLSDFKGGTYHFDAAMLNIDPGLRLISMQPVKMDVVFEPLVRKAVPVAPNLVGTPDPAFRLTEVAVTPRKVPVEGGESRVRALKEVKTLPVDVDGRWESTVLEVGLSRPERGIRHELDTKVKVRLSFEPRYESRSFGSVRVEVINTTWRTSVRPLQVRVTVEGPVRLLPGLKAASFRAVADARELESKPARSRHRLDVELENLPDTVKVVEIHPSRVLVRLEARLPRQPERGHRSRESPVLEQKDDSGDNDDDEEEEEEEEEAEAGGSAEPIEEDEVEPEKGDQEPRPVRDTGSLP